MKRNKKKCFRKKDGNEIAKGELKKKMNEDEIQVMIDRSIEIAIDKHNKSATIISAAIGSILLFFY